MIICTLNRGSKKHIFSNWVLSQFHSLIGYCTENCLFALFTQNYMLTNISTKDKLTNLQEKHLIYLLRRGEESMPACFSYWDMVLATVASYSRCCRCQVLLLQLGEGEDWEAVRNRECVLSLSPPPPPLLCCWSEQQLPQQVGGEDWGAVRDGEYVVFGLPHPRSPLPPLLDAATRPLLPPTFFFIHHRHIFHVEQERR